MIRLVYGIFAIFFSVMEAIITGLSDIIVAAVPSRRNEKYNADFLPAARVLSTNKKGFCLSGDKCLSIPDSYANGVVFGGSGAGKSSRILIPSILKMAGDSSLVIHDPSGELFEKTSGWLKQQGYAVKVLNYANPSISENYNPLQRVKSVSDIKKVSRLLIHTSLGGGGKDPFWNNSAEVLLTVFIRYVLFHTENRFHSLYNVACLLNTFSGNPEKVDRLFVEAGDEDEELLSDYKAFVAYDSKMLMSIVATVRTALSLFADPEVAKITSTDNISFDAFRREKSVLYINNNVSDMKYYLVLSSILFEQFFASIMNRLPGKNDFPVFFLLDEASSLFLSILPTAISNIRKYNAGILQIYQSQSQLFDLYGIPQGRNIVANSYSKVYMPGQPLETARELELILGKYEFIDTDDTKRTRPLLTMDEIRILKESIILIGNLPPIKAKTVPYYEQSDLNKMASLPPVSLIGRQDEENPALLNLATGD